MWALLLAACGAPSEVCDNGVDDDGDGRVDCDQRRCARSCDADGDGHRSLRRGGRDCDDGDPDVFPGAEERCNEIDDDCDHVVDDDPVDPLPLWVDADADGFGRQEAVGQCFAGPGLALVGGDCNDHDPDAFPGSVERCDGRDNSCDGLVDRTADGTMTPYTCGTCSGESVDAASAVATYETTTYNPCVLDPSSVALCRTDPKRPDTHDDGERLHTVTWRTDEGFWRDELLVFLPPGPGDSNETLRHWAAFAGYRAIWLGFPNASTLSSDCRSGDTDQCWLDARTETLNGTPLSDFVDIGPADSVEGRLGTLLDHLAGEWPDMDFDRHLTAEGEVDYSRIVVMGWSFGGAESAFLAKHHEVRGAILLSGPKDHAPDGAASAWTTLPSATPGCAFYGTWHVEEPFTSPPEDVLGDAWDNFGMPPETIDLDLQPGTPPAGTHRVSQSLPSKILGPDCKGHTAVGNDRCMRDEQFPAYQYMLCAAAAGCGATAE